MDEWERSFAEKSEKRRSRSRRRRLIRRAGILAVISLAILAGLWVVDRMMNSTSSSGSRSGYSARHH